MKKVGIVFGCWDLLHPGHLMFLNSASEMCDELIVGLQSDPSLDRPEKNRPVQTLYERAFQLDSISVGDCIPYSHESDILLILQNNLDINVRFLGTDYLDKDFTGKKYCEEKGIEIVYIDRSHNLSTSELRNRIKES